jgi:hypothetical protein
MVPRRVEKRRRTRSVLGQPPGRLWLISGVVLLVGAAAAIGYLAFKPDAGRDAARHAALLEPYLTPFPIPPVFGTMSPEAPYRSGIEAYRRGDYRRAAGQFALLTGQPERWPGVLFYRGLAQFYAGEPAAAAASFRDHLRRQANATPARWYLALALLQSGRTKDARRELATIASSPGGEYASQARELLEKL